MSERFSFNCANGCGACGVKLREFGTYRAETPEGRLIARTAIPEIVSTCCGGNVEVWDELVDDVCASVLASGYQRPIPSQGTER